MADKKTLYTLNVNGYSPEITKRTFPLLKHYAKKIGAEFYVIDSRKFEDWPITYEKFQIYELAEKRGDDWSMYLDADALVHPETVDWTCFVRPDCVAHNGVDMANCRWRYDRYFKRDGRNVGSCNWNTIASWWCRDVWRPLDDLTPQEAIDNIFPTVNELNTVVTPEHLIDDYTCSRNIAKFGLKVTTLVEMQKKLGFENAYFYWHAYTWDTAKKIEEMDKVLNGDGRSILDGNGRPQMDVDGTPLINKGWNLPKSLRA